MDLTLSKIDAIITTCFGRLAQLVERLPYKQDVIGSSPVPPISHPATALKDALSKLDKTPSAHYILPTYWGVVQW